MQIIKLVRLYVAGALMLFISSIHFGQITTFYFTDIRDFTADMSPETVELFELSVKKLKQIRRIDQFRDIPWVTTVERKRLSELMAAFNTALIFTQST